MRVLVLGTGALGCLFAARLAGQAEVWVLGTWAEAIAAIRQRGICLHEPGGTRQTAVRATGDPAAVPAVDYALLLVKSYQTERAAAWAARCLAPAGLALTLQNGLDNWPKLDRATGPGRSALGVTFEGATVLGPGEVRHAGAGTTWLGAQPATAERVRSLAELFGRAGFAAEVTADIDGAAWGKVVVNAAINPLTALWHVPNGALLATPGRRALLAALAGEAAAVAGARAVVLPYANALAWVEAVCRATAANHSSMLQDVERGRPTEIDSINGAIVAEGHRLGVAVPVNETAWRLVRELPNTVDRS